MRSGDFQESPPRQSLINPGHYRGFFVWAPLRRWRCVVRIVAGMRFGLGERSVGMCGTVSFFVEKKQSPLLHCVCGESSSPTKRSGVVKLKSCKKKRLGQKLLQVQYHRAFSGDSLITVQQDRMSRLDDHRRNGGTMILRHS